MIGVIDGNELGEVIFRNPVFEVADVCVSGLCQVARTAACETIIGLPNLPVSNIWEVSGDDGDADDGVKVRLAACFHCLAKN